MANSGGKLIAKTACVGLLPLEIGGVSLIEVEPEHLSAIAPCRERETEVSDALKAAHGMALPGANRATGRRGNRAIWFGQGQTLLMGPVPDARLRKHAAVVDQSDGWAVVALSGSGPDMRAADVLARLTPLDLRAGQFKVGHTARTDLQHMMASITRIGADEFLIMVFRGFAQTLVHDLETAMQGVAARATA